MEVAGLEILYLDAAFAVVNKPSGLLSVPGKGEHKRDCVVTRLWDALPEAREAFWRDATERGAAAPGPGNLIVHRLDMDTSGVMVVGLTPAAQRELARQFERRVPEKTYVAVVEGRPRHDAGVIDLPLRLDIADRPYQIVDYLFGRPARTFYRVLAMGPDRTQIEFRPVTGRSHQLRVHAATGLGCPIVNDPLYGRPWDRTWEPPGRLMLHAERLTILYPGTQVRKEFGVCIPREMSGCL